MAEVTLPTGRCAQSYLMKRNACSWCGSLPCRHCAGAPKYVQELVVPIRLAVFAASILRLVATSVWCHPDLQKSSALVLFIHLLQNAWP